MSVAELQSVRTERAQNERANYDLRLSQVNGQALVFVTNTLSGDIYSVNAQKRCNCPDFQHRCSKHEGLVCKHVVMVEEWLADCSTPEVSESAEAPAPEPTPVPSRHELLRQRYAADVKAGLWG